jgi:signal transduction histidine kinase
VQRRSDDAGLRALAREQELGLRRFIELDDPGGSDDLVAELRTVLVAAERRTSMRCELVVIDPPGATSRELVDGLCGAVTEALTNAAKHGDAGRVTVCLDADGPALSCTVHDDGAGFDPATTGEGTGLSRSVRGRIEELGGTVRITSQPGHGCELAFLLGGPGGTERTAR